MKNDLIVVDKISTQIENRLKTNKENNVFPLTPTHRKELRQLKGSNTGNLRTQVRIIKDQKKAEYVKHNKKALQKSINLKKSEINRFNKYVEKMVQNMANGLKDLIHLKHEVYDEKIHYINDSYFNHMRIFRYSPEEIELKIKEELNGKFKIRVKENFEEEILEKQFQEKYSEPFEKVYEQIDQLEQQ